MTPEFQPRENIDFVVTGLHGLFHWESRGRIFGDAFCNEDGFALPSEAAADAIAELSGATDLDLALTSEEQTELVEKIPLLYPADVQDYQANVQCLPVRYRERSFYAQVMAAEIPTYLQSSLFG
ncbi:MAG: hypothetical protein AAFR99_11505 [Cyanobacteria bacterium J06629_9]